MKQLAELIHYYEVRMLALTEYSSRIWNRFNWFFTLELAVFGFFFSHLETLPKKFICTNNRNSSSYTVVFDRI
ncbi:MAG: hypothetical protein QM487_01840 [Candidatus Marithrix sp.]